MNPRDTLPCRTTPGASAGKSPATCLAQSCRLIAGNRRLSPARKLLMLHASRQPGSKRRAAHIRLGGRLPFKASRSARLPV